MNNKNNNYTVDLSHNQLSFLHSLVLNYQQVWSNKDNKLPEHVDDLLQTTLHQLVTCRKQTSKWD